MSSVTPPVLGMDNVSMECVIATDSILEISASTKVYYIQLLNFDLHYYFMYTMTWYMATCGSW